MVRTSDVHLKIKEMSQRVVNPRPQIPIKSLAAELLLMRDQIMPSITELKNLRLIQYDASATLYVRLTLLGSTTTE
jgi:hypothetical protein